MLSLLISLPIDVLLIPIGLNQEVMVLIEDILEHWELTQEELTEIVIGNPSLRGMLFGYVSEYKLKKLLLGEKRVTNIVKYDNHDRTKKGDLFIIYKGIEVIIEVKSLQTATIKEAEGVFSGKFQCDASDRRPVTLPNGNVLETTCLLVGEFDLLAVNLFEFQQEWRFVFARNKDLPRSQYKRYTPDQRQYLLATSMAVTWPPQPPFEDNPFHLLDEIVKERTS